MQNRSSLLILAAAAGSAMASSNLSGSSSSSSGSQTASTITTTFLNFGMGITPVASIIEVNATSTDIVTYLINCPPTTPAPTITTSEYPMPTYSSDSLSLQPINLLGTCIIPSDGYTLVAGPSIMSLAYTNTHTPSDITRDYDCTITPTADVTASTPSSAPVSATSAAAPDTPGAQCYIGVIGTSPEGLFNSNTDMRLNSLDLLMMMEPLIVTAGVEKLAAAARAATATTATATSNRVAEASSAPSSSSTASASSSTNAAAGRFDLFTSVGAVGAAGLLIVTLML